MWTGNDSLCRFGMVFAAKGRQSEIPLQVRSFLPSCFAAITLRRLLAEGSKKKHRSSSSKSKDKANPDQHAAERNTVRETVDRALSSLSHQTSTLLNWCLLEQLRLQNGISIRAANLKHLDLLMRINDMRQKNPAATNTFFEALQENPAVVGLNSLQGAEADSHLARLGSPNKNHMQAASDLRFAHHELPETRQIEYTESFRRIENALRSSMARTTTRIPSLMVRPMEVAMGESSLEAHVTNEVEGAATKYANAAASSLQDLKDEIGRHRPFGTSREKRWLNEMAVNCVSF